MTEKKKAYISSLSLTGGQYGSPYAHMGVHSGGVNTTITLDQSEIALLEQLAWDIFTKRKQQFIDNIDSITPPALLTADITGDNKVIELTVDEETILNAVDTHLSRKLDDDIPF